MTHRPTLSSGDIPRLVLDVYGLQVKVLRELNSYDDQNFLVEVISGSATPSRLRSPRVYVFKVLNSLDSLTPEVIDVRHRIMLHAEQAGYPTPGVIANVENQYQQLLSLPSSRPQGDTSERSYVVSLLSYMPGETLDQVSLTPRLCYEVGWFAGKLDSILKDFPTEEHPALKSMTRKWNMSQIPKLRDSIQAVPSQEQRETAEEIISQFEKVVLSPANSFSKGLIHGDFIDCNIVTSTDCRYMSTCATRSHSLSTGSSDNNSNKTETSYRLHEKCDQPRHVSGVIDFGDTTLSLHIFEVAIAAVHVMINRHGVPPMQAASFVLSGYLEHISLTNEEIGHLKLCICARFVQSLILGYFSIVEDPQNNYILTHATRVWPVLKSLWEMPDSQALAQIMEQVKD